MARGTRERGEKDALLSGREKGNFDFRVHNLFRGVRNCCVVLLIFFVVRLVRQGKKRKCVYIDEMMI